MKFFHLVSTLDYVSLFCLILLPLVFFFSFQFQTLWLLPYEHKGYSNCEELKTDIHIVFHFVFSQLIRRRYFADAVPAPSSWSLASQRPRQHSTDILIDDDPGYIQDQDFSIYDGELDETSTSNRDLLALHLSRVREDFWNFCIWNSWFVDHTIRGFWLMVVTLKISYNSHHLASITKWSLD